MTPRRTEDADVGTKAPNEYGLYDTRGNLWEWSLDWYDDSIKAKDPFPSPTGDGHTWKVLRGGSWLSFSADRLAVSCRCLSPAPRRVGYGFRVVLVAVP